MNIQRFDNNTKGRDFVVGDIHGCFSTLLERLQEIDFNPDVDRLFSVGDLVDRGPESDKSIDWLAYPWFHAVRGNHEDMVIGVANNSWDSGNYLANGGRWFLSMPFDRRKLYAQAFAELPIAIEVETSNGLIGIIHADCPVAHWGDLSDALSNHNAETYKNMCVWSRDRITNNKMHGVKGIQKVIVGHTPVKDVVNLSNVHYIDTGCVYGNKLTIVQI